MKKLPGFLSALLLISVCLPLLAQSRSFTVEDVLSSPFPSALTAAGRADRIGWVFNNRGERNVWIADGPDFKARQVTHYQGDDGQDIFALHLTPDGKTAIYARGSEVSKEGHVANPNGLTVEPKQQLWTLDIDSGKTRMLSDKTCADDCEDLQLAPDGQWALWVSHHRLWLLSVAGDKPARELTELRGDDTGAQWSPDGKRVAFVADRKDHSFIVIYELATQRAHYLAPSFSRDSTPRWSPDGRQIAFIRIPGAQKHQPIIPRNPQPWALWLADADTGTGHELWHSGNTLVDSLPPFAEQSLKFTAGGKIVFCSEQDGRNHLYAVSATGGSPTLLTPGEFDVEEVAISPDNKTVLYTSNQNDIERRHIWKTDLSGPPTAVLQGNTIEWSPVALADNKTIVCIGSSATTPAMPYRLTEKGRQMIGALPTTFPADKLVEPQAVIFRSEDGVEVHADLFLPPDRKSGARLPALIYAHGGPPRQMMLGFHYSYYYHNAYAANQYLANHGYVVLSVNYRLGIMYGRAFRDPANAGPRGASEYKDILAAGHYLEGLAYVDPKRVGIWGGSYGGFLTAMALSHNSDVFAAGVDTHGVHDWSAFIPLRSAAADAPDLNDAIKLAFDSSPVAAVSGWESPVLFLHGDDDRNVPFDQTTDLVQRLRARNVPIELIVFTDEVHDFVLWKTWVKAYQATSEFFDRKLARH